MRTPTDDGLTNWAGNIAFDARRVHHPSSVDEVRRLVEHSRRVHALGAGHSFSRVADCDGDLVSLAGLPADVQVDHDNATVTVAAGVRYGALATRLHAAGLAVHNMASLPHITVAGACATGTHGSGERNGNLATAVSAIELVTPDGDLVTIGREADGFDGTVVALGALGIVTRLTLDTVPTFDVRQYVYEGMPGDELRAHLDEVLGSGYSVSLFTDWSSPTINQVWVKRRDDDPGSFSPDRHWLGATLADGPRHPIAGMSAVHCTEQLGVPGPWYARLPHFRLEFTASSGDELQSEYFVPRERAVEALDAIDRIRDRVAPVLQVSEIRTIAADRLWLSPSYQRDSLGLHFTWIADAAAVVPVVAAMEEQLAPLQPRPHWAKVFTTDPATLARRYERLPNFRQLTKEYDPAGKFSNNFTDRYGLTGQHSW